MSPSKHLVAIFGGAVSGSEAAFQLAERGIASIVFDQNALPYGKIEDGLPKWHSKLRDKEVQRINEKLSHPLVTYVPLTKLGRDITFEDITSWGFCAVLLAIGAWRDRPLPVAGVDQYVGKGLVYQNPFIYWYNHKHEPDYEGQQFEIKDKIAIVGGGLASLDVAKVIMFELVQKALEALGHETDLFKLDRSIAKVLDSLDLTLEDLGIEGCTLYYRRRIKDMPLSPAPAETPEQLAKVQRVQEKILNNYRSKYLFKVEPLHVPVDKIVEGDQLVGLVFQRTKVEDGRVKTIPGEIKVRFPYVVSSIGSIPDHIPGIPTKGQTYDIEDEVYCRVAGHSRVFALGNTVTGRGNIKESMSHGKEIAQNVIEGYLGHAKGTADEVVSERIRGAITAITEEIRDCQVSPKNLELIQSKIKEIHDRVGYNGNYMDWVAERLPVRLEHLLGVKH